MSGSLATRLWTYQAERFPLAKTVPLLAIFSAASINVSAFLSGRDLPGLGAYLVGLLLALTIFFQMRVCDEVKDREIDAKYRPHLPIPRGLVSLRVIVMLGLSSTILSVGTAVIVSPALAVLLFIVWGWLTAMTFEFGYPVWLRARPILYLISHMAIMPLIDLLLTGVEWVAEGGPGGHLWLFLALSFANGCVLEIGRKTWAPEDEREGVESYSSHWGYRKAIAVWCLCLITAAGLLGALGLVLNVFSGIAIITMLGLAICLGAGWRFLSDPSAKTARLVDTIAGAWVFLSYFAAGFLPLILGRS
ncbi:MAG: UbiA family prenyltransferase [Pseudomonadota bacterium]